MIIMELIDKDALIKELKRKRDKYINLFLSDEVHTLNDVLDYINTLEVKEVDLEKELKNLIGNVGQCDRKLAKHFFELGLKVSKKGGER